VSRREACDGAERAAELEAAGDLQVLELQVDRRPDLSGQGIRRRERGAPDSGANRLARPVDVLEGDRIGHRPLLGPGADTCQSTPRRIGLLNECLAITRLG
jgi:hypothetical protein